LNWVSDYFNAGKITAAISEGPLVLQKADLLEGRNLNADPDLYDSLEAFGANIFERVVTHDQNLITSGSQEHISLFKLQLAGKMGELEVSDFRVEWLEREGDIGINAIRLDDQTVRLFWESEEDAITYLEHIINSGIEQSKKDYEPEKHDRYVAFTDPKFQKIMSGDWDKEYDTIWEAIEDFIYMMNLTGSDAPNRKPEDLEEILSTSPLYEELETEERKKLNKRYYEDEDEKPEILYSADNEIKIEEFESQTVTSFLDEYQEDWISTVKLTGLKPGEEYTAALGKDGYFTELFSFIPKTLSRYHPDTPGMLIEEVISGSPRQIILTWQDCPQATQTITWRTDAPGDESRVYYTDDCTVPFEEYRKSEAERWTFPESDAWVNSSQLTGLEPGTEYTVVLKSDYHISEPFIFRTAPSEPEEIVIAAGGDSRIPTETPPARERRRSINKKAAALDPDFVMFNGDLINLPLNELSWDEWFDDWHDTMITPGGRRIPVIPAIGNHEVDGGYSDTKDDAPFYYNRFVLPDEERYYVIPYGPDLTVITLDSAHTTPVAGTQTDWLDETLKEYQDTPWVIAQYHVPAWPSVRDFDGVTSAAIRDHWVPLFEKYGVDLVSEAHDHAYKRTHPIRDNEIDEKEGIIYIGDGAWGVGTRDVHDPKPWYLDEAERAWHFFSITLSEDREQMHVEPIFYDAPQDTGSSFSIEK